MPAKEKAPPPDILEKIEKLFALGSSPYVAEAQAAVAKAQELLLKYNLSIEDLGGKKKKGTRYHLEELQMERSNRDMGWRRLLLDVVASHNLCRAIFDRDPYAPAQIVGQAHNIEVVRYLYTYLSRELRRIGSAESTKAFPGSPAKTKAKWINHFCLGAVHGINAQLKERELKLRGGSKALIVRTDTELNEAVQQLIGAVGDRTVRTPNDMAAAKGFRTGKEIPINDGVAEPAPPAALKRGA